MSRRAVLRWSRSTDEEALPLHRARRLEQGPHKGRGGAMQPAQEPQPLGDEPRRPQRGVGRGASACDGTRPVMGVDALQGHVGGLQPAEVRGGRCRPKARPWRSPDMARSGRGDAFAETTRLPSVTMTTPAETMRTPPRRAPVAARVRMLPCVGGPLTSTSHCSTIQYNAIKYSTAQVLYSTIPYNIIHRTSYHNTVHITLPAMA